MNEIESEVSGEVVKIYLENGEPVEFGQSLFGIRPCQESLTDCPHSRFKPLSSLSP